MALTERTEISQRNVLVDGQIQVQTSTIIERDGVEISRTYHREVVSPGDDCSAKDPSIQRLAAAEHTPEVVAQFRARRPS